MSIPITPSGIIKLCHTPLENDYKNTLKFNTIEEQYNYFNNLPYKILENYNYIKQDSKIKVNIPYDEAIHYNYLFYKNTEYSNKIYYCFIKDYEFINPDNTAIYIETDVFETYQFDITYNPCFIDREHTNDDTIGTNTIPESLETGEYICNGIKSLAPGNNDCHIAVATTYLPSGLDLNQLITRYGGIYSGSAIIVMDKPLSVSNFIRCLDSLDKKDAITSIFMIPDNLCGDIQFSVHNLEGKDHTYTINSFIPSYSDTSTILNNLTELPMPNTLNGYTPKNNKLFTFPYNYFYVTNNVGSDKQYHYEDFINNLPKFRTIGTITPGCSIKCYPLNYKKLADTDTSRNSYNDGISGAKYPICSWQSDIYTNWLTENGVNLGLNAISSTASIVGGVGLIATGAGAGVGLGMVAGGAMGIAKTLGEVYEHSLTPPESIGNTNSGDITFSDKNMDIPAYKMSVRYEFAEVIDNYFNMYGYATHKVKIPNLTGRRNWNYIKTSECNFDGDIPQDDLKIIKTIFNEGITLWHNPNTIYDYSQNNDII